jgi:hypothetical protein
LGVLVAKDANAVATGPLVSTGFCPGEAPKGVIGDELARFKRVGPLLPKVFGVPLGGLAGCGIVLVTGAGMVLVHFGSEIWLIGGETDAMICVRGAGGSSLERTIGGTEGIGRGANGDALSIVEVGRGDSFSVGSCRCIPTSAMPVFLNGVGEPANPTEFMKDGPDGRVEGGSNLVGS